MHQPDPTFPPLLTGHAVKAPARAFETAVAGAGSGAFGAGDLVWGRDTERLDCAVVFEPEVGPERAAEMLFLAMVAFADSFGALAPPEVAISFGWPGTIRVNGGEVGHARAAMAAERDDDGAPLWLAVGLEVMLRRRWGRGEEPGASPHLTDLYEEGCGELTRTGMIESYARHLLVWIHDWEREGFKPVHQMWLYRADGHRAEATVTLGATRHRGRFVGLDDHGNMLMEVDGTVTPIAATDAIEIVGAPEAAS